MFSPSITVQALIDGGKLKALAVTGAKRSKFFPDIPTVAEGGLPGYASVARRSSAATSTPTWRNGRRW